MKKLILPILLLLGVTSYWVIAEQQEPEVIKLIRDQGVDIVGKFDAPAGLKGYAGAVDGQPLAIYLTADNEHALIGSLINADGEDLGENALYDLVSAPQFLRIWAQLENAHWVVDGNQRAKRIIYTFTDVYCPYCQRMRQVAAESIASNDIQLRHIMVGVIRENSVEQAARILGATDPIERLAFHIANPKAELPVLTPEQKAKGEQAVNDNNLLMEQLGIYATPSSFYKDSQGRVRLVEGLPMQDDAMDMFNP